MINIYGNIAEDKTVTSSGSYNATAPNSAGLWVMQMATFRSPNPTTVTAISPVSGSANGGTAVTITGTGFLSGASVKLGGTAGTAVTVLSSTSITATTPAHVVGPVDIVVTNSDGQSRTLAEGYAYTSASTVTAFVQVNSATATSGSSIAIPYTNGQIAGDLNAVAVMWGDRTSTVSSVTDSNGNTYALAAGPTKAVSAAATGTGTTANSGSATTTSASELIVGVGNPTSAFAAAGSGFSNRIINAFGGISEDRIVSSTGSYNATATLTSGTWVMQMAAFRASGP